MDKIRQKYNKIKEKLTKVDLSQPIFVDKKMPNWLDIDKNAIKNILLTIFAIFLLFFTYCTLKAIDNIKSANIEISAMPVIKRNIALENKIRNQTAGFPMENMTRIIAKQDEQVAAFLVAIAKKESNWGKRTPKLNGEECNNLWGFRQKRERMGSGGHTCFDNQKEAVELVALRIKDLIDKGVDTPEEMIVWKCGYNCDGHDQESVEKWISDVKFYYNKF